MEEKFLITARGNVYYCISSNWSNDRDTIFFFHGLTADHTLFEKQISFFESKFNVIIWDAPCHGNSRPYTDFSFENTSMDIMQILQDNHIENIIAVGQSLGGYYIQAFIKRYPEKVKAFIGIGTTPYGDIYYSKSDIFWLKQVEWIGMCCSVKMLKNASAKQATYTEYGYRNMMKMIETYSKKEYCHLMQIAYSEFLKDNQDIELKCPVLITYGEHDKVGKVRKYCNMWHKNTGFPIVVIKNAGHNANADNHKETNQIINDFLSKIRRDTDECTTCGQNPSNQSE